MIIELLLTPIFWLINSLISLIPVATYAEPLMASSEVSSGFDMSLFFALLGYGFYIFPAWLFFYFIGIVIFWNSVQIFWAIIEWFYKKIPGVN